jgi:hypothetical protein
MAVLVLWGCEPGPEDVGYEECDAYDPGAGVMSCEVVDICCEVVARDETLCAYVTQDGRRYECLSEIDCNQAAQDLICDVCDMGATTANYVCR